MGLRNRRHERFARELAKGKTAIAAYKTAGYAGNRPSASRLARRAHILARVEELEAAAIPAPEDVTVERLVRRLLEIASTAEEEGARGAALSVARASLMDVARLSGLLSRDGKPVVKSLEEYLSEMWKEEAEEVMVEAKAVVKAREKAEWAASAAAARAAVEADPVLAKWRRERGE